MRNTNVVVHIIRVAMKYINAFQDYLGSHAVRNFNSDSTRSLVPMASLP